MAHHKDILCMTKHVSHLQFYLDHFWYGKHKYKICHVTRYHTIKECKGSADEIPCHHNKIIMSGWPNDVAALCNRKSPKYLLNR